MTEQEPNSILCNANTVDGCALFEGFGLKRNGDCPNPCRGGQWNNPYILQNGIRVQPCGAELEPDKEYAESHTKPCSQ